MLEAQRRLDLAKLGELRPPCDLGLVKAAVLFRRATETVHRSDDLGVELDPERSAWSKQSVDGRQDGLRLREALDAKKARGGPGALEVYVVEPDGHVVAGLAARLRAAPDARGCANQDRAVAGVRTHAGTGRAGMGRGMSRASARRARPGQPPPRPARRSRSPRRQASGVLGWDSARSAAVVRPRPRTV